MYNNSSKQQVIYSLEQLTHGLFYCLQFQSYEEITISAICKKSGITRRTYYRNCEDKKDLIIYSTDRLINKLLDKTDFHCQKVDKLYVDFFKYWYQHRDFLMLLHKRGLFDIFLDEFLLVCNESMRYPLQEESLSKTNTPDKHRIYSNAFVVGGLAQMLKKWAEEGFSTSVNEIAKSIVYLAPDAQKDIKKI